MGEGRVGHPIWLTRLVWPGLRGKLVTGALIGVAVWVGVSTIDRGVGFFTRLFFASLCAYIVPVFRHILEVTDTEVEHLAPDLEADADTISGWRWRLQHQSSGMLAAMTVGAIAAWLAQFWLLRRNGDSILAVGGVDPLIPLIGPLLVWLVMTHVVSTLTRNALVLARIAEHVRIDLLRPRAVNALARIAVVSTLAVAGAQAIFVFLILDSNASLAGFVPGFLATAGPMVALFLIPTLPLRRRLREARTHELERVDAALTELGSASDVRLADPQSMARLSALLAYRREIREVSEWPFDVPALIRLGLYFVIPPLTWVGAALIENLVDELL